MEQKTGLIFDLDGTLLNTITDLKNAMDFVLKKYNFPLHSEKEYISYVGDGIKEFVKRSLPHEHNLTNQDIDNIMEEFSQKYKAECMLKTTPFPEIKKLLLTLQNKKINLAVLSNKIHPLTYKMVLHYFPEINFDFILGISKTVPRKPNPQALLEIISKWNIPPNRIYMIGDSKNDILVAQNAKINSVFVEWGFGKKENLDIRANHYIKKPFELLEIIKQPLYFNVLNK
jgi:phosphoglycolate phosphatase